MAALPALRPIACVAALNATAQGLVGVIVSILALCVCFCALGSPPVSQTGNDFGEYLTYYLQGRECGSGQDFHLYSGVTGPAALRLWVALSLFFSASMMVSSIALVVAVAKQWSDEKLQITLVSWLFINTFTAVDDVILGYVFSSDCHTTLDNTSQQDNLGPLTLAIIAFLAVRGVYLWLLNLVFIVYLFGGARSLHKYLNEQIPPLDQEPIETWPTLDDFGKTKGLEVERSPPAVNTRLTPRVEATQPGAYPEYTAMARWPTLNGQAPAAPEGTRERRTKPAPEYSPRRQEGVDNQAYEGDKYYLRLQSETGSTRDYEDLSSEPQGRVKERLQQRSKRLNTENPYEQYKQKPDDAWSDKRLPNSSSQGFPSENYVTIPPIDYLDAQDYPTPDDERPLSLQEAILDRTLRLKKVPDELKRGFQK